MDVVNGVSWFDRLSMQRMAEIAVTGVGRVRDMCIPGRGARVVT